MEVKLNVSTFLEVLKSHLGNISETISFMLFDITNEKLHYFLFFFFKVMEAMPIWKNGCGGLDSCYVSLLW